ncbi:MAG: DUF5719 family protein [Ilumatobacteraceae bacterium]
MRRLRINRRHPVLVALLATVGALVWVGSRPAGDVTPAAFSVAPEPWIPAVPRSGVLESVWFCPGVPATGEPDVGGVVVITNPSAEPTEALVTFVSDTAPAEETVVPVGAFDRVLVDVDAEMAGNFVATIVEIIGGGGLVEQRAFHPAEGSIGQSSTPCTTTVSPTWFLADGYTVDEASNLVIVSNPSADQVVVDVAFHTRQGVQRPSVFTGLPIAPRSLRVIDVATPGAGARGESSVGVSVTAARGAVVVGRSQSADDGFRGGPVVSLGSPVLSDQWWFADGEKGPLVNERFSVFNPTDEDVEVSVVFLAEGVEVGAASTSLSVPAGQVAGLETGTVSALPEGRHAAVFSTLQGASIVVDRALTRVGEGRGRVTSVSTGLPVRRDGLLPTTWYLAAGPSVPVPGGLTIVNLDALPVTVDVRAVGSAGPVPVPGLDAVEVTGAGAVLLDLVDEAVLGRPLIVTASGRVLVERRLPSAGLVTGSWAIAGDPCC